MTHGGAHVTTFSVAGPRRHPAGRGVGPSTPNLPVGYPGSSRFQHDSGPDLTRPLGGYPPEGSSVSECLQGLRRVA